MENVDFVHKNKRFGQKQYSNAVLMCSFSVFYFCFCLHVLGFLLLSLSVDVQYKRHYSWIQCDGVFTIM